MHLNLEKLYKRFFDIKSYLLKECKFLKQDFDSRTDFILENIFENLSKDKDVNNNPYGWIGIGLNILGLYEKDGDWLLNHTEKNEWVDGYITFSKLINQEKNGLISLKPDILHDLAFDNDKFKEFEKEVKIKDKNHWRIMEKGIYVHSKIKNTNIKNENILLNVKVKKDEICVPKNEEDIWLLDAKFIRVYRILFKNI